jgi:hypothetical protein
LLLTRCSNGAIKVHQQRSKQMTKTWTNPQTKQQIKVVVVKEYGSFGEQMFLVHKSTATSSAYVFGVKQKDCR